MSSSESSPQTSTTTARRYSVGYALPPKKVLSFIQPSLLRHAGDRGVDLIPINPSKPLIEQAPFDCVIHKLYDEEWKHNLNEFSSKYPNVPIIDPPAAIERIHDRISMLQVVNELEIETVRIPKQTVVYASESLLSSDLGLRFPLIAKSLVADGTEKSHQMFLVFDRDGLINGVEMEPPFVLQEFVNHGGVVFKVYVVGEKTVKCVRRRSLPDISDSKLGTLKGFLPFSQISSLTSEEEQGRGRVLEEAEMPPLGFVCDLAGGLRRATGLHLFNFDMIRIGDSSSSSSSDRNRYLVIDINYFPGYAKMPDYETALTDFFLDIVHKRVGEATSLEELKERRDSVLSCGEDQKKLT